MGTFVGIVIAVIGLLGNSPNTIIVPPHRSITGEFPGEVPRRDTMIISTQIHKSNHHPTLL